MKLIDLSQPVYDQCPNCPVHPPVRSTVVTTHEKEGWRLEELTLASHTGSHIDAPLHKVAGAAALDDIPLESFVGPAFLADLRDIAASAPITAPMLARALPPAIEDAIVLLATGWGERRAKTEEWCALSPFLALDGAQWLVEHRVRGVGIDHYTVGGSQEPENSRTHEALLSRGIWILEDLRFPPEAFTLSQPCRLWTLPIHLPGHSGAFCRPVLVQE